MPSDSASANPSRPVDAVALGRARRRLEAAERAPWLHEEAARRMAERLPLFRRPARRVIDWWPRAGGSADALVAALAGARIDRLGEAPLTKDGVPWWKRLLGTTVSPSGAVPPPEPGAHDLVWANMLLHHVVDPRALMSRWRHALAVGGFLMFSTLGPGTLQSLRERYRRRGWGEPMAPLVDMHDLGDMLVEAGFADPVMDQEAVRLRWGTAEEALSELRSLGANAAFSRSPGLRTPRWRERLLECLAQPSPSGGGARIELEFELVYGHAFNPEPRHRVAPEARIAVEDLRQSLRRSRGGGAA